MKLIKNTRSNITIIKASLLYSLLLIWSNLVQANNPLTTYIVNGDVVPAWKISIGNGLNYNIPYKGEETKTTKGNLTISKQKVDDKNDALRLKWKGKKVKSEWGGNALYDTFMSIGNHKIDIADVENSAALAIQVKVNRSPSEAVNISMQCKYNNNCSGKLDVKQQLKKLPKGEWDFLTIPLNCFNKKGDMDFTKVTKIFSIATQGKLEIEIANLGLVGLPAGSKGCKS